MGILRHFGGFEAEPERKRLLVLGYEIVCFLMVSLPGIKRDNPNHHCLMPATHISSVENLAFGPFRRDIEDALKFPPKAPPPDSRIRLCPAEPHILTMANILVANFRLAFSSQGDQGGNAGTLCLSL